MKFQQISEGLGQEADVMEQDHEVQMARADCFHAAKHAIELHKLLRNISEQQGLEGWVSEKITLAADYLRTVKEYLEYEQMGRADSVSDLIKVKSPDDYNEIFSQYMNETVKPKKKSLSEDEDGNLKNASKRIKTPNLSARGRELLIKAFARFPQSNNEIDAIVNYLEYIKSAGETDVNRLDQENRVQDQEIDSLEIETGSDKQEIQQIQSRLNNLEKSRGAKPAAPTPAAAPGIGESRKTKKQPVDEMGSVGSVGSGSIGASIAAPSRITPKRTAK